jgi:cytidylate kinase
LSGTGASSFAIGDSTSNLIITISGLTGTGKSTLGDSIAERLKIKHITRSHKAVSGAKEVVEFAKNASVSYEKEFDKETVLAAKGQDCVVTAWLAPWLIEDATVRVWLYADLAARIKRKAEEMKISAAEAEKYINEKDNFNLIRFKEIYSIDLEDRHNFDMLINTSRLTVEQCTELIIFLSLEKDKKRFR